MRPALRSGPAPCQRRYGSSRAHGSSRCPSLVWRSLLVLTLALPATGCDADGITVPAAAPAQTGVIVEVDAGPFSNAPTPEGATDVRSEVPRTIWVKEDVSEECGIVWTFDAETEVLVRSGSALRRAVDEDLRVDRPVRVWTDGPVAESCPAQGVPTAVELR